MRFLSPLTGLATAASLSSLNSSSTPSRRSSRLRLVAIAARTLIIAAALSSCGGDSSTAPVAVASVDLTPVTNAIDLTQTVQLTATAKDAGGNALSGRAITWSQGNSAVAIVSSTGLVSPVAPGATSISATSEGRSGVASITVSLPSVTLLVTNQLVDAVAITVNGTPVGTVPASSTAQTSFLVTGGMVVSYDLVRPLTSSGTPMGEQISGVFPTIQNASGTYTITVNNILGTQQYFSPMISNSGAYPILMVANWGLASENRCNCTVLSGGNNVNIGYYRLFTNSEVRGYGTISGYGVGTYSYWNYTGFSSLVQSGSGAVLLTNTATLSNLTPINSAGVPGLFTREITATVSSPSVRAGHTALGQAFPRAK
jgi:Bacterial Ig-like domain (group 2)